MEARRLRDKATEAFTKGRFSKSAEFYEQYCRVEPKDYQARLRMGDAWAKAGQKDRAVSAYQFAAEGFAREGFLPRAIAASKLVLEMDPTHRGVQQMLADLYARKSAGGDAAPPRAPARRVELPTFTEHMAVTMGPAVAPIELPEEDEPAPPPPQAPAEQAREEELAVIQGIPLTPIPVSLSAPAPGAARPSPPAPAVSPAPAPQPAAREPVPVQAVAPSPAVVAAPPPAVPLPAAAPVQARPPAPPLPAAQPPRPLEQTRPAQGAAPPGLTPRATARTPVPAPAAPAEPLAAEASAAPPAPAGAAPPGLRPRRPSAFTELELETDTLLHAVEEAALAGMKRRAAEASEEEEEGEVVVFELTEEVISDAPAADALPNIPLFSDLPRDAFIELFERCPLRRYTQGLRVFDQGSLGNAFYVICEGSVRVFREEGGQRREIATLGSGAFFGEMALLSGAPRMASVESVAEDTQLLEISAPLLSELSSRYPQVARALKKFCRERLLSNVMSTSALFQPFGRKDRRALVEKFRARDVRKNDIIVREGEWTDGLYVVLSGEVEARKGDQVLARLKEGELFGEISLLQKKPATATVMAIKRTSLLRLPREDFDALILTHPQILVLVAELTEQRLMRTEALMGERRLELSGEDLLV